MVVDAVTEHHPLCDDNGWDHPGQECVVETDFYGLDGSGPYGSPEEAAAHDDWLESAQVSLTAAVWDILDARAEGADVSVLDLVDEAMQSWTPSHERDREDQT